MISFAICGPDFFAAILDYTVFIEFQTLEDLCVTRTNQEVANIQVIVSTRILASQLFVEMWQESPSRLLISLPWGVLIKILFTGHANNYIGNPRSAVDRFRFFNERKGMLRLRECFLEK